jgi:hypothetical protein
MPDKTVIYASRCEISVPESTIIRVRRRLTGSDSQYVSKGFDTLAQATIHTGEELPFQNPIPHHILRKKHDRPIPRRIV